MHYPERIDLHMHSSVSDGTDSPEEILSLVKEAGIQLFSLTDHDAIKGCRNIRRVVQKDDPFFITGIEFSCKDEEGKYHILGYNYDPEAPSVNAVVQLGHSYRMQKVEARIAFLRDVFGFMLPDEEVDELMKLDNPGKPHIGNLLVKHGYVESKDIAIKKYINQISFDEKYVRPEEAIEGILKAGGVPVLAHPSYGSGDEIIIGEEMDHRLQKLISFGLQGVEAYYSAFTKRLISEMLDFAEKYDLYVTAGSDYHGRNKLIELGDNNLEPGMVYPEGMCRFLDLLHDWK